MRPVAIAHLAALLLAGTASAAFAQDAPSPEAAARPQGALIALPGADARPRGTIDPPAGPPAFDARLPRETPVDIAAAMASAPVTDFVGALQRAYWTNPALLAERARLRATDFRLPQARAAYGPRLSFEASYGFLRDNFESPAGGWTEREGWTGTAAAVLTQPVFTFGRNGAGENEALARIAFQRAALRSTEAKTLFGAIRAYAQLLRDRNGLQIYQDDLALLARELSDNQGRFTRREVTSTDVQQVETRIGQARAQVYSAQRVAASSEALFLNTIGAPAGELAPPNPLRIPVASLEEAYAYADAHNPVIGAAYARERISRAARDGAKADMMPRVDLTGRAEYGSVSPYSDDLRQTELRGQVVVSGPVFESGLRRARYDEAEAANDADWRLIDAAIRESRIEVADAWNEWLAQNASIEQLRASADSARAAFDGALLQEKAGMRTTLDVLNLARELLVARAGYNNATASAYLAQARLLAALGVLEQGYLFPDAPEYDPDAHFERTRDDGDFLMLTPLLRTFDAVFSGTRRDRALRDPAAGIAVPGVALPVPAPQGETESAPQP